MKNTNNTVYAVSGSWDWDGTSTLKGLHLYRFHEEDGTMEHLDHILPEAKIGASPVCGNGNLLYVVEERGTLEGRRAGGGGYLHVIRLNKEKEKLEPVQRIRTLGVNPSFCAIDPDGRYLAVVHHTSTRNIATKLKRLPNGSVVPLLEHDDAAIVLFALNPDGTAGDPIDYDVYEDENGKVSLLHSVYFIPGTKLLVSGDKGLDRVHVWRLEDGHLSRVTSLRTQDGSDTRYIAFHPQKKLFYVNNEQKPLLYTYRYQGEDITQIAADPVLEDGLTQKAMASDLIVSSDGKYLYNFLRVCNRIAIYELDEEGLPRFLGTIDSHGSHNRGVALSPDGRFLYACNMESDVIAVFEVGSNGQLLHTRNIAQKRASNLTFCPKK